MLNKLDQYTLAAGLRVDEGHQGIVDARPGLAVDQRHAAGT
jgi:hypothetical protein